MNGSDAALRALIRARFEVIQGPPYKKNGDEVPFTLLYIRPWGVRFTDVVHVRGEEDFVVRRARADGPNNDLFAEANRVWSSADGVTLAEAIDELLALNPPDVDGGFSVER
ncbi:hypothetical protein AB0K14_03130 [Actinosynnema sp. NPDC050801]|uniref:hypothetical protein n=1 Tax=unclassified Actinosynnema TaxID=2637065 RepID=UPI0033C62871